MPQIKCRKLSPSKRRVKKKVGGKRFNVSSGKAKHAVLHSTLRQKKRNFFDSCELGKKKTNLPNGKEKQKKIY